MKKNVMKTMVAAVCVAAAGMGSLKAYNAGNQSEVNVLLAENVVALSAGEVVIEPIIPCPEANARCKIAPGTYLAGWKNVYN